MLTQEQAVEIKILARQGMGIRSIARELGISRNTVRRYLQENPEPARYRRPAAPPTKLDPFKAYLQGRMEAARPHWIPATVLLREIQAQGYGGGYTQLKAYLAPFRKPTPEPLFRFETAPGQQMQADFTTIRLGRNPLRAFVATLGYSRASFVRFCSHEDGESWLEGLRLAFAYFGGVPRRVLFDNARSVILERDAYGEGKHRWHPGLLNLAGEYGFQPQVCRPYRAKTKGKVERFNRYLKESFVTPLLATLRSAGLVLDVDTANAHVGPWLENVAHLRVHGTTGVQPAVRLVEERQALLPLPLRTAAATPRTVERSGQVLPHESIQHPLCVYDRLLEGVE
ncbi:IS21 family transposase [Acidithiobacillus sp. AMEEHan]|uniref:IS21 family transposase n=1 Tax=Acidithiobacillus sp. AMEEHan TaxID=2994951 RepID=UPI0027E51742|nr:IS21 family transposase [Acidithiobacillus sp. AMEEHan]